MNIRKLLNLAKEALVTKVCMGVMLSLCLARRVWCGDRIYPAASPERVPSPWWYFGRAVYVSRRDYKKIFYCFFVSGVVCGALWVLTSSTYFFTALISLIVLGFAMLGYSLIGLYRMYGHPAEKYFRQLLKLGNVAEGVQIADLHIGTYRHSFMLSKLLPKAQIFSIDCWSEGVEKAELAIQDVRDLEPIPHVASRQIEIARATDYFLPLKDSSCDVAVFGFGTHEIPTGGARERLFAEATRILKPGGKVLLFEHGIDPHNFLIFGPVIHHVTKKTAWESFLRDCFKNVKYERSSIAVDLFAAEV